MEVPVVRSDREHRNPLYSRVIVLEATHSNTSPTNVGGVLPDTCWVGPLHAFDDVTRLSGHSCVVIRLDAHATPFDYARSLAVIHALVDGPPVVLAGRPNAHLVRAISGLRTSGIVWEEDISVHLWPTIARVRTQAFLAPPLSAMSRSVGVRPALRIALTRILARHTPTVRVSQVAREARCHRTTLSKEWRRAHAWHPGWPERIEDLLGWIVISHAVALARPDRKWSWVAECLGIHTHTVMRLARRLTGLPLGGLLTDRGASALGAFVADVTDAPARRGPSGQQIVVKGNKSVIDR